MVAIKVDAGGAQTAGVGEQPADRGRGLGERVRGTEKRVDAGDARGAQLKRAEAKNKELQVRYGNRPDQRRPRTAVY